MYLAIDLGTSAVKVGLFDRTGGWASLETVEYSLSTPAPQWVECDLSTYWGAVVRGIGAALQTARGAGPIDIAALSISSQGETLVVLDRDGLPLRPAIVWLDNRASDEAEELKNYFGLDEIYRRTGQIESIPTWTAAKISWLAKHEPGVHERAGRFVLLEDWLIYRLTGAPIGEHSLYVTTLLLDIRRRQWWLEMLDHIGIDVGQLSPLVAPGVVAGLLSPSVASELGLPPALPVVAGALDQVLAATGAANIRPGLLTENTGTVLGLATCVPSIPLQRAHGLPMCLHVIPDMYCAQPCGQTAGLVLRWFGDNFYGAPSARFAVHPPYYDIINEARDIAAGADGLIVVPHLAGAQFPEFDPSASAAIVGLTLAHTRGHVCRAVLEAVAFMLRSALQAMRSADIHLDELTSLGNSAESDIWTQIKADVCQLPVRRLECSEPSLLGAAMLCAVAVGDYSCVAEASSAMVRSRDVLKPDRRVAGAYDDAFANYQRVSVALRLTPAVLG